VIKYSKKQGAFIMKYGFLGSGNMASAIINGMIKNGFCKGYDILVFNRTVEKAEKLSKQCGVKVCSSQKELIENSDVFIISVKPNVLDEIASSIKADLGDRKPLIISIAVGKTLDYLKDNLGSKAIVRVMPNINAKVLASESGYCANGNCTPEQKKIVYDMFSAIGSAIEIPEKFFGIFGVIAGSSPAFAYIYINALAKAAVKAGMPKAQALEIAANTVLGSAKMVLESNEHPCSLTDMVCSPGGTTIEGVCALDELGFENTVIKAFDAVLEKDKKISGK
jgi:pyrroline-5-carboxylate reductase